MAHAGEKAREAVATGELALLRVPPWPPPMPGGWRTFPPPFPMSWGVSSTHALPAGWYDGRVCVCVTGVRVSVGNAVYCSTVVAAEVMQNTV